MQIIIDIDEDDYKLIKDGSNIPSNLRDIITASLFYRIRNGKLLPKGHGRLIDADEAEKIADNMLAEWLKELKRLKEQEPSGDFISRQAVLDYIYNDLGLGDEEYGQDAERQMELAKSYKYVKSLPSVTPQPKIGRWIEHPHECGENWEYSRYECSICHNWEDFDDNFCPNCGAYMESEV